MRTMVKKLPSAMATSGVSQQVVGQQVLDESESNVPVEMELSCEVIGFFMQSRDFGP